MLACIIASFLFSAAETALTSIGRLEVQTLIAQGGQTVKLMQKWMREPSRFLITVLVGNNFANVMASSLMALWAYRYYPHFVSLLMGVFTFVIIIFAEIVPKLIARHSATLVAPYAVRFLQGVGLVLTPISL